VPLDQSSIVFLSDIENLGHVWFNIRVNFVEMCDVMGQLASVLFNVVETLSLSSL